MGVPSEKVTVAIREALSQIDVALDHETDAEARQHLREARRSLHRVYAWHGIHRTWHAANE